MYWLLQKMNINYLSSPSLPESSSLLLPFWLPPEDGPATATKFLIRHKFMYDAQMLEDNNCLTVLLTNDLQSVLQILDMLFNLPYFFWFCFSFSFRRCFGEK